MTVAIVTGGASGIGLGLVRSLVARGWQVTIADLNETVGLQLVEELGPNTMFHKTNVAVWEDQVALFKATKEKFGRIDYVAANAGIDDKMSLYTPVTEGEPQKPNLITVEVDLHGPIYSLYLSAHYFRMNNGEGGRFVITSSNAGLYPLATNPLYSACKHGIIGLVRSSASVFIKENITVNCICPAFVPTNLAPKSLLAKFPKEHITPVSTIVRAFEVFADDAKLTGQVAECSLDQIYYRDQPEYPNESERWIGEESQKIWADGYDM